MNGINVSAVMTAEQMAQARNAVQILENLMPFLIQLGDGETGLASLTPENTDFVTEAHVASIKFSHVIPQTIDVPEFGRDLNLFKDLAAFRQDLSGFTLKLDHTIAEVGAEAYFTARYVYKQLQMADKAGVPGLKPTLERLGKRFQGQGNSKKKKNSGEE
jgi:hypothetical protein